MAWKEGWMESEALHTTWANQVPDDQWAVYQRAVTTIQAHELPFALGGAFALAAYTGNWRNTKDLDLYILPQDRASVVDLLTQIGLSDYYDQEPYDRAWIYRSHREQVIVDAIWAMANGRADVAASWLISTPTVHLRGEALPILPVEELIWAKLYVFHRDRCDWPDVLNLIAATGTHLDWAHLLDRLAEDVPLLCGALSVYRWICPGLAQELPGWLWERLHLPTPPPGAGPDVDQQRVDLLDSRAWFFPP
jgi:hypothetical protein